MIKFNKIKKGKIMDEWSKLVCYRRWRRGKLKKLKKSSNKADFWLNWKIRRLGNSGFNDSSWKIHDGLWLITHLKYYLRIIQQVKYWWSKGFLHDGF